MLDLTLQSLGNMLRVNKHRLDDELEMQGEIAFHVLAKVADLESRVRNAKDTLESVEARLRLDYRESGEKMTVDELTARVQNHRERVAAFQELDRKEHDLAQWKAAAEAWRQRSHALSRLAELHGTEYFSRVATSVTAAGSREVEDTVRRAAMREASRAASESAPARSRVRVGLMG